MRLPRVRVTVRRGIVAAVVAAGCASAFFVATRGSQYRNRIVLHFRKAHFRERMLYFEHRLADLSDIKVIPGQADPLQRRREYYERLRRKYKQAAAHPWLLVEPDPPGPE